MISFLAKFGKAKANQLSTSFVEAIVRFDPETASEAQIAEFEAELTQLTQRVAVLRREYTREQKEADAAQANYNRYVSAAEKLQAQIEDPATSADKKDELEKSQAALLTTMEGLAPEMDREIQEAKDAKEFLDQFEKAASDAATKVTTARIKLKAAMASMEKAKLAKATAHEKSEHAAALAGIRTSNDSLGTALSAMEKAAQKDRDAAAADTLKADLLTKALPKSVESDPNVLAALGETSDVAPVSLTDRLAALKARRG